ncbi:BTB/POZ and TAZ domain-containing protein 4 [Ricinus communis]|uniref:BTB/POZ and TAZ domain-containing protein 4 n=1 Tax=Ricinus communis TaxID=3988 RepID=UPI00201AE00E|nr:BTB/POZ and TAZ domain-containing protein 4 [Ricinus communis]XP_048232599.1 BTB/POZ and TAZ domain-containing protein 4 [Ricinus communis]
MEKMDEICDEPAEVDMKEPPSPPPLPCLATTSHHRRILKAEHGRTLRGYNCIFTTAKDMWERLFDEGYRADVIINTDNGGSIYAHANILGMASPVMKGMLKQSKGRGRQRSISIRGVPHDSVRIFIRFLYSSCYEKEEMVEFVLHLLVLSHVFVVPDLKKICVQKLVQGFLTTENVVDIFQLALLCDAPRLSLVCHRMIVRNFQEISITEGWKAMRQSHPVLEKELLDSMVDEDKRQKERIRRSKERKIYLQLYEAMEALVHICRDGCRTIGPHDKDFRENQAPCNYEACKGLEQLVRHFASCKLRIPGGCIHCKRMWQLLELHSRLCADSDACRVPLCKNFKARIKRQSKKDEIKWRILVKKIIRTKRIGGSPFFTSAISCYS